MNPQRTNPHLLIGVASHMLYFGSLISYWVIICDAHKQASYNLYAIFLENFTVFSIVFSGV